MEDRRCDVDRKEEKEKEKGEKKKREIKKEKQNTLFLSSEEVVSPVNTPTNSPSR